MRGRRSFTSERIRWAVGQAEARHERSVLGLSGAMVGLFLVVLALVLVGCVPPEAIEQARRESAINAGHAADAALPAPARAIGTDNADAWSVQLYALDGTRLPEAVADRLEARGALPEGYVR